MAIVIASDIKSLDPWIRALKKRDPGLEVVTTDEVKDKNNVEFILAWNYPHGLLRGYPRLRTVYSMGAGVDHVLCDPFLPENINVLRIIDPALSQDIYEFSLAAIMNRIRLLNFYLENQRKGIWKKRRFLRISDVRIGIMGTGIIGTHVLSKLHETGFKVSGWGRTAGESKPYGRYAGPIQLNSFLQASDILICLLPLTPATRNILNRENLKMLPKNAWVINLGRGGHLVDHELIDLLDSGHLDGATLDVFREEPLPVNHRFWNHPKIFITPHTASLPNPEAVAPQIIENYYRTINNEPLYNKVNQALGY
jgi:glyoxylate/hydroxypyruvate reductase